MRFVLRLTINRPSFRGVCSIFHIYEVVDVLILDENVLTSIITVVAVRDCRVFYLGFLSVYFIFEFLNTELHLYQLLFLIFFCQTLLLFKHFLSLFQLFGRKFSLEASTGQNIHDP